MNEQDQKNQKQEPPKPNLGGRNSAPSSAYKKTLSRKWISPALFVAAAAIIVTVMWLYQGDDKKASTAETPDTTAVAQGGEQQPEPVTVKPVPGETAKWPVASTADVTVKRGYFDAAATPAEQDAAMVEQGNTFSANTGIDLARSDDQPFDVQAVLSGKVTLVQDQPTNGTVVEITHSGGYVSVYQSLTDVTVKQGDDVKQSTVIGKAGKNELQKDLGVHLHFALLKNNEHVNPNSVLPELAPAASQDSSAASGDDSE
ncbi:peptidoglycan DD-metalloendopeptidase family protein [Paenibacillus sp. D51F]